MTAICTSCAKKHQCQTERGIWSHSGKCHTAEKSPIGSRALRLSCQLNVEQEHSGMKAGLKPELQREIMPLFIGEIRS
jgi:hypothetical protein